MATFKRIIKSVNEQDLIKPNVTLEYRRFTREGKRWTVICRNGWPMDNPVLVERGVTRSRAREIATSFLDQNRR